MTKIWPFAERGIDVTICEPVCILGPERVHLKNRVMLGEFCFLAGGMGLHIGNFVHVAPHVTVSGGGYCVLEDFVSVCAGVRIVTGTDDVNGEGLPGPMVPAGLRAIYRSYVHCGRHAFIGTGAILLPGVSIGEGAVVGAGSVVTRDLEPWGIYLGSPARRVRERKREKILELQARAYASRMVTPSDFRGVIAAMIERRV